MRRTLLVLLLLGALLFIGWRLLMSDSVGDWTTSSRQAREELELGLAAAAKYYHLEADRHFASALDLDPDFVMPKLMLMISETTDRSQRRAYRDVLRHVDTSSLTEREAFLLSYHLARRGGEEEAADILERYLEEHPEESHALELKCAALWDDRDLAGAEQCYEHLLKVTPNWVAAENRLGYLAMGQGDLDQAEDRFLTYRYMAPDQANPHDSLGELYVVRGRWKEAEASFEAALDVRADFCVTYANLLDLALYSRRPEMLPGIVERIEQQPACVPDWSHPAACVGELMSFYLEEDWVSLSAAECQDEMYSLIWLAHFGALMTGDLDRSSDLLELYRQVITGRGQAEVDNPLFLHMAGLQSGREGHLSDAVEQLYRADELVSYWGAKQAMLKLYNRYQLAVALRASGKEKRAEKLLDQIEEINAAMAVTAREGRLPTPIRP